MPSVRWNNDRFTFDLPDPSTPLRVIRDAISERTGLPRDAFKIIHAGAIMKDDNAPISAYSLKPKSTLHIVGSHDKPAQGATVLQLNPHDSLATSQIDAELAVVRERLTPALHAFIAALGSGETSPVDVKKEHVRLGELLLQSLERLDALTLNKDADAPRKQRKAAVKEVQSLLEQLDAAWNASGPTP